MEANSIHKIIGYVLLAVGLLIIIVPLFQAYNIITGISKPYEIFKYEKPEAPGQPTNQYDVQKQLENAVVKFLPLDLVYKTLNLTALAALFLVFIFGGGQIGKIAVKMLKD